MKNYIDTRKELNQRLTECTADWEYPNPFMPAFLWGNSMKFICLFRYVTELK